MHMPALHGNWHAHVVASASFWNFRIYICHMHLGALSIQPKIR